MAAYLIADIEVKDPAGYEEYRRSAPPITFKHGGRYLVTGGELEVLEGSWAPRRTVVVEFPTMEHLQAFYNSAEYAPLKAIRMRSAHSHVVAVQGTAVQPKAPD